jgi:toluene monooxygenase system protein E
VVINLVAKPALDEATLRQLAVAASAHGDELLALLCHSHRADVARSRRWTAAFVRLACERRENRAIITDWLRRWVPLADAALRAYLAELPGLADGAIPEAQAACRQVRAELGLTI